MVIGIRIGIPSDRDGAVGGPAPPIFTDTKSVTFDGISERLGRRGFMTTGCEFDWNEPFTVNAWVRGTTTAGVYLASKQAAGSIMGWAVGFYLGQPLFFLCNSLLGSIYIQEAVTQTTMTGSWKMVTFVYSGSGLASGCTTYINGTSTMPVPSGLTYLDALGGNTTLGAGDLDIGRYPNGNYFDGSVADLSIWKASLSPAEVATLYNQGAGIAGKPLDITGFANLESWWRMGDGPGDSTGMPGGQIFDQGPSLNNLRPFNTVAGNIVTESPGEAFWNLLSIGFDGIDERVNMGSAADFSGVDQEFTAAVWFKTSDAGPADIFGKWLGLATRDWVIFMTAGRVYAYMQTAAGTPAAASVGAYNDGAWHLAVMSWSAANGITIDIDGGAERVSAVAADRLGNVGSDVLLGARDNGGGAATSFYNGRVDEASFYLSEFDAADCVEMYHAGSPIDLTSHSAGPPNNWWRCGDATFDAIATGQASIWDIVGSSDGFQTNMEQADMAEDTP